MSHRSFSLPFFCLMLVLTATLTGCGDKHPAAVATPPALVEVAVPVEREVTDHQIFTARTQALQSVDVKPRVTGYLTRINFKDGGDVKGQEHPWLLAAGLVGWLEAPLAPGPLLASAALYPGRGQADVLFEIDNRPYKAELDKAKGDLEFQKASLVKSQADLDIALDTQKLNPGAISKQEISKRTGTRDEAAGSVKAAQGTLEKAQLNYDWCKVVAPISGRTNRHFIDIGNLIAQDQTTLTNIVSLKPTWAYFDVDENTALRYQKLFEEGKIKAARNAEVPVRMALGQDKDYKFHGAIDFLSNQLDPNTGSIRVRAVFPNEKGQLLAGMFGRIEVPLSTPHKALLVTDQAVGTNQGQKYVLVVNDEHEVEYRPVEIGQMHEGLREVYRTRQVGGKEIEVLKPTDRIIVSGLQRVRPGSKVEAKPVDMESFLPVRGDAPKSK